MTDRPHEGDYNDDSGRPAKGTAGLLDFAKRSAVAWSVGLLIVAIVLSIAYAIDVLLVVFAGVLVAILLRSAADYLGKYTGMSDNWSLAATVLLIAGIAAAGTWLLIPSISEQTDELQKSLPKSVEHLQDRVKQYEWGRWLLEKSPEPEEVMPRRRNLFSGITGLVSGTAAAIGGAVVILFMGLYLACQPHIYREGIVKLFPIAKRPRAREVLAETASALRWWLLGKMISMLFVGVLTWLGLWLLGVQIALTLAVLAALLTFIPNFGPILSAIPAVLIGMLVSPMTGVWVVVLYVAIQTVESYLITPMVQQQTVSLPPALTITAQLVMAVFVGGVGFALATPLTVVLLVLVRLFYIRDMLGDESEGA